MTAELTYYRELPAGMKSACEGCALDVNGRCSEPSASCTIAAANLNYKRPDSYYWYDPLVHITNRLKA